jgi:hypothetical protein
MNELFLLLLVLLVLPLVRAAWSSRRRPPRPTPFSPLLPEAVLPGEIARPRRRGHRHRESSGPGAGAGLDELAASAPSPDGLSMAAPFDARHVGALLATPTREELRRAIVWSEVLGPARGLVPAPGPEADRTS